jgi:hypothetical protein
MSNIEAAYVRMLHMFEPRLPRVWVNSGIRRKKEGIAARGKLGAHKFVLFHRMRFFRLS